MHSTDLQGLAGKQGSSIQRCCAWVGFLGGKCPQHVGQALRTVLPNPLSEVTSYSLQCQHSQDTNMCHVLCNINSSMYIAASGQRSEQLVFNAGRFNALTAAGKISWKQPEAHEAA